MNTNDELDTMTDAELSEVPGWPGYLASRGGDIFSTHRRNRNAPKPECPRMMSKTMADTGYYTVTLTRAGRPSKLCVHQVIMLTFRGERPAGMVVAHNNGNPLDNRLENLRWDTYQGNSDDMKRHGTNPAGVRNPHARLTDSMVIDIRSKRSNGHSTAKLASHYGLHRTTIQKVCNGVRWPHVALIRAKRAEKGQP